MYHHTQLIFVFLVEMGFCHVGQAVFEVLASSDPPDSASKVLGLQVVIFTVNSLGSSQSYLDVVQSNVDMFRALVPALGRAQWLTPVIPALWESEAVRSPELLKRLKQENCLNPGGDGGCNEAEMVPLHSSLANRATLCLKKKIKTLIIKRWLQYSAKFPNFRRPRQVDHLRSGVRYQSGQHGENPSLLKQQKISWVWWCTPVIPATRKTEIGESLEPGRHRLQAEKYGLLASKEKTKHFGRPRRADHEVKRSETILANMLLGRLRQENCLNPGGGGCSEPRLRHCTPAWHLKEKEKRKSKRMKEKEEEKEGERTGFLFFCPG
ncbi:Ubiquitin-conjugating enzyme E2 variant 3 [Plecturocebus cupreus]